MGRAGASSSKQHCGVIAHVGGPGLRSAFELSRCPQKAINTSTPHIARAKVKVANGGGGGGGGGGGRR